MSEPSKRSWRCGKCGRPPAKYVEYGEISHTRWADEAGKPEAEGTNSEGYSTRVEASCTCGHSWRLRGITHMGQVEERFGIMP